jgi:hypothetical protein
LQYGSGDPDELEVGRQGQGQEDQQVGNNQASFGGSLLKNNMEVEAAMEMQRHRDLDETGVHRVCTNYVCEMSEFAPCLIKVCSLKTSLISLH